MRGRKSYNIRNIEAHLHNFQQVQEPIFRPIAEPSFLLNKQLIFNNQVNQNNHLYQQRFETAPPRVKTVTGNLVEDSSAVRIEIFNGVNNESQKMNEYVNAKYGVSRYASNQVSGKMFKGVKRYNL